MSDQDEMWINITTLHDHYEVEFNAHNGSVGNAPDSAFRHRVRAWMPGDLQYPWTPGRPPSGSHSKS